jgi:hypothetical protein
MVAAKEDFCFELSALAARYTFLPDNLNRDEGPYKGKYT